MNEDNPNIPQEEQNPLEPQIPQELEIIQRLINSQKEEQSEEEPKEDDFIPEDDNDDSSDDSVEGFKSAFKPADSVDDDEEEEEQKPQEKKSAFDQPVAEILAGLKPATPSCCGTCSVRGGKLHVYDWLDDLPEPPNASDLVEVQFKNTRKSYYRNQSGVQLHKGDIVAVESSPGHDIGEVTLVGRLVYLQMHKYHINPATYEFKKVYRIARPTDIEKWEEDRERDLTVIYAVIFVSRPSHKAMVIGRAGASIKQIGTEARRDIQALIGGKVHLQLWVKVKDNWTEDTELLHDLGLQEDE